MEIEKNKVMLTGDRPTGALHLGHYVGSLLSRVEMQSKFDSYIMVADAQALTDNFSTPEKVRANVYEVVKDYIAVGIDPKKATIFVQSQVQELAELTFYYLNLVTISRLERNPTVKSELQQKEFGQSIPAGFLCYPVSQAADITAFKAEIIPVGEDQLPLIETCNEIVRKFNRIYRAEILLEAKASLSREARLIGIDGKQKASKSLGNAIMLCDEEDVVKEKVFSMFTDPNHIHVNDPGNVEVNVVFTYLDAFHDDRDEIDTLKQKYRKGGLGDKVIKSLLNDTLQKILFPIRERRKSITKNQIDEILIAGTEKSRAVAAVTLSQVKGVMGLSYW
ncbi:tryptophan--tRNA ligase [Candidatus Hydrogenosomobacter endosymbioticus]|uniref:Tryptophan--tRNA ligase n=1 Tax=Candidatus Hydrogenosomobacter endosymbioticus TaxID=2558174 RepID=A0ABM7V889_9PROT|nr:tryptophan--tRNA ligase [Candidatus Hydrogenosomobacter endosymbioticus]BDB95974.1 tryptophan--tRNA ligase [Candidatus Hydrogenosomobacter endosymbioticus]